MLPCGSQPTSVGRQRMYFCAGGFGPAGTRPGRRRPAAAADHHQHLALRAELGDQVGALVHRPDVVVLVDADRVREFEAVVALADFLDEGAVVVEFEQARRVAAVIDEDVALRVGGDGDRFAQILPGRQLEEVRHGRERDVRHARDRRLLLRERGADGERQDGARGSQNSCHRTPPLHAGEPISAPAVVQRFTVSRAVPIDILHYRVVGEPLN